MIVLDRDTQRRFELAAREHCKNHGIDPDEKTTRRTGMSGISTRPRWLDIYFDLRLLADQMKLLKKYDLLGTE